MPDALVDIDNHIMTVTLNRPARKNAMTLKMFARMDDAWRRASEDPDIRVCILTGAEGNFSSGMDLRAMAGDVDDSDDLDVDSRMKADSGFIYRGLLKTVRPTKPVIAGNGPLSVEAILKTLHETEGMTEAEAFAYEQDYGSAVFRTEDAKEGPKAFAEKRKPHFQRK